MSDVAPPYHRNGTTKGTALGCLGIIGCFNLVLMGLLASTFAVGPYASVRQEIWYRGGSISFVMFGAVLPMAAALVFARRSPKWASALALWMFAALLAFVGYAFMSGGGI